VSQPAPTNSAAALLSSVSGGSWVGGGLSAGGGMAALDATIRPIEALAGAGLGWLTSYLQPLQAVVDRMAGNSGVIQTFADAWQKASTTVNQVGQQLTKAIASDTANWHGTAGDNYRSRATEITTALQGVGNLSSAQAVIAKAMGAVTANARQQAGTMLTELVQRLIPLVAQASATGGGLTPAVLSQATTMINSYKGPIAAIEQALTQTTGNAQQLVSGGGVQLASVAGAGTGMVSTWQSLQNTLSRQFTPAQFIQVPPSTPSLPPDARPLTKARLNEIAQNPIFYGKLGLNVTIGNYAEDAALRSMGYQPNTQRFYPDPADRGRFVIPDGVSDREVTDVTVDQRGIPVSTETHTLDNGVMVEVKATSGTVTLDTPREQMQKYVDVLAGNASRANNPDTPTPWLVYATTADTQLDPAALAYAQSRGVAVWQAPMYESGASTDPNISVGTPIPMNGPAQQDLSNQLIPVTAARPVPLFNSPYDTLLRRQNLLGEQQ
jgi:uncharacterized protein YukE